ncbi:MAG: SDR family oxidoreductase [Pseudomonadota bacterium]
MPLAVITGAAGGIGRAIATRLSADGWRLHLIDVREDGLGEFPAATRSISPLDTPEACRAALPKGPITALVHMAGIFVPDQFPPNDRGIYDAVFSANATNAYDLTAAAAPQITDGGRIVLASSLAFNRGAKDYVAYTMAKGAIAGLARALARRLGPRGITVNAVAPGIIETPMTDDLVAHRGRAKVEAEIPLGRLGQPEDVAGLVRFLIGPDAAYITGQLINVDGGIVNG